MITEIQRKLNLNALGAVQDSNMNMHNKIYIFIISISLSFFANCTTILESSIDKNEIDILETVFRYQFAHNGSYIQDKASAYCIAIRFNDDPPLVLLNRFKDHDPSVIPWSECKYNSRRVVVMRKTNQQVISFDVRGIIWISSQEVKVYGTYYENGTSAAGYNYEVRNTNGKWEVVNEIRDWVS